MGACLQTSLCARSRLDEQNVGGNEELRYLPVGSQLLNGKLVFNIFILEQTKQNFVFLYPLLVGAHLMIFCKNGLQAIAKALVKFDLTGTENEVYHKNAEKAMDIWCSDIEPSTGQRYGIYWTIYCAFCVENGHECLPSSVTDFCVLLTFISRRRFSAVMMARGAISL